jgi:transposase-like protein
MDNTTCYCRHPQCPLDGRMAPYAQWQFRGWPRHAARFRCQVCPALVSARTGTAYAGIRTDATTDVRGATAWAEGRSIRATGRLLSVDKDTVHHWWPLLGAHCQHVRPYFWRHRPLRECQLDELWTFIGKKEARLTSLEKRAALPGDAWVWIACRPVNPLGLTWVVGTPTLCAARPLGAQRTAAPDGHLPFFPREALPHEAEALLEVDGVWMPPLRQGTRGRFPHPRRCPPPDLCSASVVKERQHGRGLHGTTRVVYGPLAQVAAALQVSPVSRTLHIYGVERNNLTVRQHARRLGRKVNAFSKEPADLGHQLTLACASSHFVVPHRSVRQRLPHSLPTKGRNGSRKQWKPVTPAMAAGLTDQVWTMAALLSFRVPLKHLWG